jgi:Recombinase
MIAKHGGRSLRAIAAELEQAGYPNERGRRFHPHTIKNMLR